MAYTQEHRLIAVNTPLGKDVLLLLSFTGEEGISRPFHFHLNLLSTNASLDYKKIIGQKVSIRISLADGKERYISGHVSAFSQSRTDDDFTFYEAEVVPWLWFLTRTADLRMFQNKTIPDIIKAIFSDLGFNDYRLDLRGSYSAREYCVQYRETDFNFVCRLMEQYGIFYFFEHTEDKHTLVLGDEKSVHKPCPNQPKALFDYTVTSAEREDAIRSWVVTQELRPGKYTLTDYNFETPSTSLLANVPSAVKVGGNDALEIYDYPGEYEKKGDGDHLAKIRMEEEETPHLVTHGAGFCRGFISGYRFDLQNHARKELNQSYLLTEVQHSATVGETYTTGAERGQGEVYSNRFVCIPASVPFRPPRATPKPFVQGPQPAMVVGPSGEEIYTDKYGRVKVHFYWDREGKKNENSSCWIRVSQPWGGKQWGGMAIPRIGQEVIVQFLEGDPDRPIITGRVYNADQMPPYSLPDNHTRTTIKSRSSKGGGASNYNEIRFEDKKGSEQLFLHAERDMDVRVKKQSREWVGADRHLMVKGDQKEKVDGNKHEQVGQSQNEKVGMNLSLDIGQNHDQKVGMKYAVDSGMEIHLKAGMNVVIESGVMLTLKAAGGFININPAGVFISGMMVFINSGGAAGSGSGASPQSPNAPDQADDGTKGDKM